MPRGRKKDMTIPQTRALTTQRAYRARKAQYLQDLEERCQVAETENARLRAELAVARADAETSATVRERHAADAAQELLQTLSAAQNALVRFQRVAFPRGASSSGAYYASSTTPAPEPHWPPAPVATSPHTSIDSGSSTTSQPANHHPPSHRHNHHHHHHHHHPLAPSLATSAAAAATTTTTWRAPPPLSLPAPHSPTRPTPSGSARLSIASLVEPHGGGHSGGGGGSGSDEASRSQPHSHGGTERGMSVHPHSPSIVVRDYARGSFRAFGGSDESGSEDELEDDDEDDDELEGGSFVRSGGAPAGEECCGGLIDCTHLAP